MKFTIYGSGCSKCQQLSANAEEAANSLGVSYELEKVTDVKDIIAADIMRTPALSVDGEIVSEGKVASVEDLKKLLGQL